MGMDLLAGTSFKSDWWTFFALTEILDSIRLNYESPSFKFCFLLPFNKGFLKLCHRLLGISILHPLFFSLILNVIFLLLLFSLLSHTYHLQSWRWLQGKALRDVHESSTSWRGAMTDLCLRVCATGPRRCCSHRPHYDQSACRVRVTCVCCLLCHQNPPALTPPSSVCLPGTLPTWRETKTHGS